MVLMCTVPKFLAKIPNLAARHLLIARPLASRLTAIKRMWQQDVALT